MDKCPGCDNEEAWDFHPCPFAEEIDGDESNHCNCCEACTHECAQDI